MQVICFEDARKLSSKEIVIEKKRGKGNVVRRMFSDVIDANYFIMIDADNTYDISQISEALKKISYYPIYVVHIGLEKHKIKKDISGFGVLTKPADKKSFLGIIFNSRIFPHVAPVDKDLITVMVGGYRQEQLLTIDKDLLFDKIIREVRKLISYDGVIIMKQDFLWKKGIPQYGLNHDYLINEIKIFLTKT